MLDLSTLNPPQREAVTTTEGPLLVLAGAGSGKTRVIAHRVAWLMLQGVDPEAILAVTFTNKAAAEMRERVSALAGAAGVDVFVSTFHSFGLWLLQQEHGAAGLPRRFGICDAGDQAALVKRCMREVKVDDRAFDARRVLFLLSGAKNALAKRIAVRPEGQGDDYDLVASEVFPRYQAALRAQRAVDFDDLIALPVELLHDSPEDRVIGREPLANEPPLIALSVMDQGAGIAQDVLPHIFEPYFTTKAEKGTGLGLAIVSRLVQDHRGLLHLRTKLGEGTRVTVYFAAKEPSPSNEPFQA